MFVSLYTSFDASEPFTTCEGGASVSSKTRLVKRACGLKIPVIGQKLVVQPDAVFVAENSVQNLCSAHIRFIFVTSVLANLTKVFALDSLQKHIIAVNNWKEKILVNFVNIVANCILDSGARVFYSELVNQRTRDVLDKIDIEKNRQGTRGDVISFILLGLSKAKPSYAAGFS